MKKFVIDLKKKGSLNGKIETFYNTDQNIYVGTSTGHVNVFFIQPERSGYNILPLQGSNITKGKLAHIEVDEELNIMFILHDGKINLYQISPNIQKKKEIEESSRCSAFCRSKRKIAMVKTKKIYILKYRKSYNYELIQEIKSPIQKILRIGWAKQHLCVSSANNFYLLDCNSGSRNKSVEELIQLNALVDNDFLMKCLGFSSIFGMIQSQYNAIPLSDIPPQACGLCFPYIVFVSSKGTIDCYNLYRKKINQTIPFRSSKARSSSKTKNALDFKGFLISENKNGKRCFVVGREKVMVLTPFDIDKQIRILIRENRVEESLRLFQKTYRGKHVDKSSSSYIEKINGIYETAGFELLFHSEEYSRGFGFLKRMGALFDPREVIFLFPDLIPRTSDTKKKKFLEFEQKRTKNFLLTYQELEDYDDEESEKKEKFWDFKEGDSVDIQLIIQSYFFSIKKISPTEKDILKNYHNLRKALTRFLSQGLKGGLFVPPSDEDGPPPSNVLEILEVVKYALLKLYMTETKDFDKVKELMKNWKSISTLPEGNLDEEFIRLVEDTNPVLLSYFYWSDGRQREALQLLKEKRPNQDVETNGVPEMIELLSECENEDLIVEFLPFVIEEYTKSMVTHFGSSKTSEIDEKETEGEDDDIKSTFKKKNAKSDDDWEKVEKEKDPFAGFDDVTTSKNKSKSKMESLNISDILTDNFNAKIKRFDLMKKKKEEEEEERKQKEQNFKQKLLKSNEKENIAVITDQDILGIFVSNKRPKEKPLNPERLIDHLRILPDDINRKYLEYLIFEKRNRNKKFVTLLILNYIVTIKKMKPLQAQRDYVLKKKLKLKQKRKKKKKKSEENESDLDDDVDDQQLDNDDDQQIRRLEEEIEEIEEEVIQNEEETAQKGRKKKKNLFDYDVGKATKASFVEKNLKITPGTEYGLLGTLRKNLLLLLKDEHLKYDENEVLRHLLFHSESSEASKSPSKKTQKSEKKISSNVLIEELLFLFKKMNNHRAAIELLMYEKNDEHSAKDYCLQWYDQQKEIMKLQQRTIHEDSFSSGTSRIHRRGFMHHHHQRIPSLSDDSLLLNSGSLSEEDQNVSGNGTGSGGNINDLEYNPLLIILLDLCFNQNPKNEKFGLYILKKYAHMINPMEALNILPKSKYQIRQLVDFLSTIIENSISKNRKEKLMYHLHNYLYVKEKARRAKFDSRRVVLRENTRCIVCRKLIGEKGVFVVYPDLSICHRYCVPKKKNILIHPKTNRNFDFFPLDIDKHVSDKKVLHPSAIKY